MYDIHHKSDDSPKRVPPQSVGDNSFIGRTGKIAGRDPKKERRSQSEDEGFAWNYRDIGNQC
jgi:hypothetical protein